MITAADLFCGAGGTSTGLMQAAAALGISVDLLAVNHCPRAIETHSANHPRARHECARIDQLRPEEIIPGGRLNLLLASPECTHHSVARGGKPCSDQSRAQPWLIIDWASRLYIDAILIENVPEFIDWGPLGTDGKPLVSRKGATFRAWVAALESLGYSVDWRVCCAADYGTPTTRRRLFVQAVRGRRRIMWPNPTHSDKPDLFSQQPWRTARDIIDWQIPGQSIFSRKKPLSPKTMARIMAGLQKFGPHVVAWDHQSGTGVWGLDQPLSTVTAKQRHGVVQPYLVHLRGTSDAQVDNSARPLDEPVPTLTAGGGHVALVEPYLVQVAHDGPAGSRVRPIGEPLPTVCGNRGDWALAQPFILSAQSEGAPRSVDQPVPALTTTNRPQLLQPFLVSYYGNGGPRSVDAPVDTITTKDRLGLCLPRVEIHGETYLLDIHFRMLTPRELAAAQGFPADYQFTGTKTDAVKMIGNAVCPPLAAALIRPLLQQAGAAVA